MRAFGTRPTARGVAILGLVIAALLVPIVFLALQARAPEQVEGFVMNVHTKAPLGVDSFDLLTGDGRHLTFQVGALDVSDGFDAGHLVTHQITLQPVVVTYRRDGDRLIAIKLADGHSRPTLPPSIAPAPPASGT